LQEKVVTIKKNLKTISNIFFLKRRNISNRYMILWAIPFL
jgi:hypothetical protein